MAWHNEYSVSRHTVQLIATRYDLSNEEQPAKLSTNNVLEIDTRRLAASLRFFVQFSLHSNATLSIFRCHAINHAPVPSQRSYSSYTALSPYVPLS